MACGLSPSEFWDITPREAGVIMKGAIAREARHLRLQQGLAYTLAQLMTFAMNDPKHMPKFDRVFPDGKPRRTSPEEVLAGMRAWSAAMESTPR